MPKGRHLKPEFFTDRHIVSISPLARLLYQGLWCYAADCGHLDDEPLELKMRILPADNCEVEELLDELSQVGRIERKDGVIFLPKLSDHARVDKRYETRCGACKTATDHAVTTTGKASLSTPNTTGSRRDHSVTTTGSQRDHDADGDGDGDGDGEVMVKGARKRRAHQLPPDFAPKDQHRALAAELGLSLPLEFDKFRDYWIGEGKAKVDWDATLRNWLRNSRSGGRGPHLAPTRVDARDIEQPPDGLSPAEYAAWDREQRMKRAAR